ncbi:hypothetical protein LK540_20760 [Massilia sp. IC2-278]|uniref:hypothetical protein n=1 Tax=Massilia sp. IC2-278 TaxID=2887200 RepID=UPI001E652F14|nr:hypothetical protein [Massilia sp. IC2-278]MCC2962868.1 hypothetical protein [Massilia sp. IC2-278]
MNPRTVHQHMKAFPSVDGHLRTWINLMERDGSVRQEALAALIAEHIGASELLVWAGRKTGGLFPREQALAFICEHLGKGEMRIADKGFTGFVVVASNGVATGWSQTARCITRLD